MSKHYEKNILNHIAHKRYQPQTISQLARDLGIDPDQRDGFGKTVKQLLDAGQVVLSRSDTVALPPPGKEMTGLFRLHERGFGFIVPDEPSAHGDLFIPPGNNLDALSGDRVRARVQHKQRRAGGNAGKSPYIGQIVEIIQRSDKQYVGTLTKQGRLFIVQTDGRSLHQPVVIRDPQAKNAKVGDKVAIELVDYPDHPKELPEGVITEVLGEAGQPQVETLAVIRAFGLPEQFPPQVLAEARKAAASLDDQDVDDREDLTGPDSPLICTIDPPDAKDYDDAISIGQLENQSDNATWELGVHIADVAYFVQPGSALDKEAYIRGNSTYLPRKVLPMLPEVLSNGVCSLQEMVKRFAKSCFLRYDAQGNVVGQRFARTVIQSAKRLTYLEAQALIDDDLRAARKNAAAGSEPKYPKKLIATLKQLDQLARIIRQRRLQAGMIVLDLPQVELIFDESGRVIDAQPEDNAFTHTIIEMFMVEANEAAARLFDSLDVPMIRRVHPDPDIHQLGELRAFSRVAGFNIPARPKRKELQTLLDSVRDKPSHQAVHLAVLKTLSKAEYAPIPIGHFALASEHYTHFTSPIRRYPDFIIHRGIDAVLDQQAAVKSTGGKRKKKIGQNVQQDPRVPDEEQMVEIARHCSATERQSESAERELRTYLVLELLSQHLGEDFDGTVTGITGSGIYVQLDRFLIDGFIALGELAIPGSGQDRWKLNTQTGALVAQRSGNIINIGSRFVVRIANVNLPGRQMELVIVDTIRHNRSAKPAKRKQPAGARKALQLSMKIKSKKKSSDSRRGKKTKGRRKGR